MTKRRCPPKVLHRVYGDKLHNLADTIIFLLPPPISPCDCTCSIQRCLRCVDPSDRISILLLSDDPPEYCQLLIWNYAVLSDDAPPLLTFDPSNRQEQRHLVEHTVELLINRSSMLHNVICTGYDKLINSSFIIEHLSSFSWCHLLRRIGDEVMIYLLKYSSIFTVLPCNNYRQVTGWPIHRSFSGTSRRKYSLLGKRSRLNNQQLSATIISNQMDPGGSQNKLLEMDEKTERVSIYQGKTDSSFSIILADSVFEDNAKRGKRGRPSSWQRHGKQRSINRHSCGAVIRTVVQRSDFQERSNNAANLLNMGKRVPSHQKWDEILPACFCCLLLKEAAQKGPVKHHIERRRMFYNLSFSHHLFPRNHILTRLKPNDKGAISLFRNILHLHGGARTSVLSLSHSKGCSSVEISCITHLLLNVLKDLIRRVRRCRYLRILNKHCSVALPSQRFGCSKACTSRERVDDKLQLFRALTFKRRNFGYEVCSNPLLQKSFGACSEEQQASVENQVVEDQVNLNGAYCTHDQVVSFLWAICRSTIPEDLLGISINWRNIIKNISLLIRLRRFETLSMKQCKHGIKTSQIPLLSNFVRTTCCQSSSVNIKNAQIFLKHEFFERWISWFYSCYLIPLVSAHFYVTDSEVGRRNMYYYRKHVWKKITDNALIDLKSSTYQILDPLMVKHQLCKRTLGFSKLRFLPKENGVRPIANLKRSSSFLLSDRMIFFRRKTLRHNKFGKVKMFNFKAVNSQVRHLLSVFRRVKIDNPEMLSSSVFDYNNIYSKLHAFITSISEESVRTPRLYIVACDVWKAFDTINQDKLLLIMKEILHKKHYQLKNLAQVSCRKTSVNVRYCQISVDRSHNGTITDPMLSASSHLTHGVFVDQPKIRVLKKSEILHTLSELVKGNLLQFGSHLYLQQEGIPQGSVLSSLLCSFYYSHLEREIIFPWLNRAQSESDITEKDESGLSQISPECVLLRLIDDYLFISTSKKQAMDFFSRLKRGFREYNCQMNSRKFFTNFDLLDGSGKANTNLLCLGDNGEQFLPWAGLLIKCRTLEIQADYSRYLRIHMSSTLTVPNGTRRISLLKRKLCDYMRPKCHAIFYDASINSASIVRLNIYQAFLLCAMKFHCYICSMSRPRCLSVQLFSAIQSSLRYMYKLIVRRMRTMWILLKLKPVLELHLREVEWLGLMAYSRILGKKQSRYVELLKKLKARLAGYKKLQLTPELMFAVDDSHSSIFWRIRY